MLHRIQQVIFVIALLLLSWLALQAIHELGHVIGAAMTGGSVTRVVLHPLQISRTDVVPNPQPAVVVWLGPLVGSLLPLGVLCLMPRSLTSTRTILQFFAGLCLIANGAYIGGGSSQGIGDCGQMARTGTPIWVMLVFGLSTVSLGLVLWHQMGSLARFTQEPQLVTARMTITVLIILLLTVLVECVLF